ncbi:MAG: GNAT family N-acetyltransferase [Candidatus Hodarchaeota archaeon]
MATTVIHSTPKTHAEQISSQLTRVIFRSACLKDVEVLGALWLYQRSYHKQWDKLYETVVSGQKEWKEYIKSCLEQPNHCILVAEDRLGRVVGYIHGSFYSWPFSPNENYGSLNTIAVWFEAQGQGVGKKLVQRLLGWFKEQNIQHISVHVDYRNRVALQLYKDIGFRFYQQRLMLDLKPHL